MIGNLLVQPLSSVLGFYYSLLYNLRVRKMSLTTELSKERKAYLWSNSREPFSIAHFASFNYQEIIKRVKNSSVQFSFHFFEALL